MPHDFGSKVWTKVGRIGLGARKSSQPGMFSNAHSVNNPNAIFQDVAGNVHYHNYPHTGEGRVEKKEELSRSFDKPELPTQRYSRLQMSEGRGYPLPDPKLPNELSEERRLRGVMIGDVGTVTNDGYFEPFFNVCEPPDGIINESGVPEGFVQLGRPPSGPKHAHNYRRDTAYEPGAWLTNGDVEVTSHPMEPGNPSGTYGFECGSRDGAILVLPGGASREDLANTEAFLQYASKHGISWYKFVKHHLGRCVPNGSIYFITGYDKTSTWGTASFSGNSTMPGFRMHYNGTRWDQPGRASVKQDRKPREHSTLQENQCTFLRGYKITLSSRILCRIRGTTVAETSPIDEILEEPSRRISFGDASSLTSILRSVFSGRSSSTTAADSDNSESESTHPIITPMEIHPSSVINQYLLNKFPESDLAITHDSVWCSYLEMRRKSKNQVLDSLLDYIESKCTSVHDDGVTYLKDLAPAARTEIDAFTGEEVVVSLENADAPDLKQVLGSRAAQLHEITEGDVDMGSPSVERPVQILIPTNTRVIETKTTDLNINYGADSGKVPIALELENTPICPHCRTVLGFTAQSDTSSSPNGRRARRSNLQVEYHPDCPASEQSKSAVKGTLYAASFNCMWNGCGAHICRRGYETGTDFHRAVYSHLESHATNAPGGAAYRCHWDNCAKAEEPDIPQHKRDRVRHLTTHLPWFILCLRCAALHARLDVIGSKPCAAKTCEAKEVRIRMGLEAAREKFGEKIGDVLISEFLEVVLSVEKAE